MSRGRFAFLFFGFCLVIAAVKIALPFALWAALKDACRSGGSGCSALTLVGGTFSGLALVIVFLVGMLLIFHRRLASAGMSRWWLLAVFLFAYGANGFLYAFGNSWSANFSAGILVLPIPYTLIALVMFGSFLAVYDPSLAPSAADRSVAWKIAALSAAAIIVGSSLGAFLIRSTILSVHMLPIARLALQANAYIALLPIPALLVFGAALARIALARPGSGGGTPTPATVHRRTASRTTFGQRAHG